MKSKHEKLKFSLSGILIILFAYTTLFTLGIILFVRAGREATVCSNVKDIRHWAAAITAYINEHGTVPTNPHGSLHPKQSLVKELIPYLKYIRLNDRWGDTFRIWTGPGNRIYGILTSGPNDFIISSYGYKGNLEDWNISQQTSAFYPIKRKAAFQNDIVFFNGRFIHGPFFTRPDQEDFNN